MVAHGASIEREVIVRVTRVHFGIALPVRSICTLALERRLNPNLAGSGAYRLAATRARYGLPAYSQHDALSDALAAGELLLAQLSRMPTDTRLGRLEAL
jgi:DNA polymerase-3 subunit epsilon